MSRPRLSERRDALRFVSSKNVGEIVTMVANDGDLTDREELRQRLIDRVEIYGGVQVSSIVKAFIDDALVAIAVTVQRPLAAYTKIVAIIASEGTVDTDGVKRIIAEHVREQAFREGSVAVKWEVHSDDEATAALVSQLGFQEMTAPRNAVLPNADEIADGQDSNEYPSADVVTPRGFVSWRQEPEIRPLLGYWRQTTRFTCGPVALLAARSMLQGGRGFGRVEELSLWRDATSGAGTEPAGLALAAAREGLTVQLVMMDLDPDVRDRSQSAGAREVRRFIQRQFRDSAKDEGVELIERAFTIEDVQSVVEDGAIVILLIDIALQRGEHIPHWVTVYGFHDGVFLVEDAATAWKFGETWVDLHQHPVPVDTLDRQAWWGNPGYRAMIVLTA